MQNINNFGQDEPLAIGPRDAARALGISSRTLWEYTKRGTIPHQRLGRRILYPVRELRDWLAGGGGTKTSVQI